MKKFTLLLAIITFCSAQSQNLILNPSCELPLVNGEIPNWTETIGNSWEPTPNGGIYGLPTPTSGTFSFYSGTNIQLINGQNVSELEQNIDLTIDATAIDTGTKNYFFNGYTRSFTQFPTDQSNIFIQFLDVNNVLLTSFNFGPFSTTESWNTVNSSLLAPVNARKIKIKLRTIRLNGSSNVGLYDDLYLGRVPFSVASGNPQTIAAGGLHSLFVCGAGTVKATGNNIDGQLGNGTNSNLNTLTPSAVNGLTNVIAVASRNQFSLFLKSDGTVWACGSNSNGQLGIGSTINTNTPVQIPSLSGITKIAAGIFHSLFLKNDGTVWSCGRNVFSGELGNGNQIQQTTPVQVINVINVVAIAAGDYHSMFLQSDGIVKSCGSNADGGLGIGNTTSQTSPTQVPITNVAAIAGGFRHSIFVKQDGTVLASGINTYGALGNGTNVLSNIPVQVNNLTGIIAASAGQYHSLYLKNDGTAWACGFNDKGQLGDGTLINKSSPVQVLNLTNVTNVSGSGYYHSLFSTSDNKFYSCGQNGGALGDGTNINRSIPVLVLDNCAPLSITENTLKSAFTIYPNPSTGIFTIQTENPISNANITIADLNGRIVHESKTENLDNKILDLNNLQNGIYILNISNGDYNHSQKIVKQ